MIELVSTISGSSSIATNPPVFEPWFEFELSEEDADEELAVELLEALEERPDEVPVDALDDEAEDPLSPLDDALSVTEAVFDVTVSVFVSIVGEPPAYAENAATDVSRKAIERTELRMTKSLIFS